LLTLHLTLSKEYELSKKIEHIDGKKRCCKCKTFKSLNYFGKDKSTWDGLHHFKIKSGALNLYVFEIGLFFEAVTPDVVRDGKLWQNIQ